jgi:hypothetical protein
MTWCHFAHHGFNDTQQNDVTSSLGLRGAPWLQTEIPDSTVACASVVLRASQVNEINFAVESLLVPVSVHLQLYNAVAATGSVIQFGCRYRSAQHQYNIKKAKKICHVNNKTTSTSQGNHFKEDTKTSTFFFKEKVHTDTVQSFFFFFLTYCTDLPTPQHQKEGDFRTKRWRFVNRRPSHYRYIYWYRYYRSTPHNNAQLCWCLFVSW